MCGCEPGFICTRCWPGLVGARDWRDLPVRLRVDLDEIPNETAPFSGEASDDELEARLEEVA